MPVIESVNPKNMRPASARRRPSMPNLLDSIPEVCIDLCFWFAYFDSEFMEL